MEPSSYLSCCLLRVSDATISTPQLCHDKCWWIVPATLSNKQETSKTKHLNSKANMCGKWHGISFRQEHLCPTAFLNPIFNHAMSCHFVGRIQKKHADPSHPATIFFWSKFFAWLIGRKKNTKSAYIYITSLAFVPTWASLRTGSSLDIFRIFRPCVDLPAGYSRTNKQWIINSFCRKNLNIHNNSQLL